MPKWRSSQAVVAWCGSSPPVIKDSVFGDTMHDERKTEEVSKCTCEVKGDEYWLYCASARARKKNGQHKNRQHKGAIVCAFLGRQFIYNPFVQELDIPEWQSLIIAMNKRFHHSALGNRPKGWEANHIAIKAKVKFPAHPRYKLLLRVNTEPKTTKRNGARSREVV